MTDIQRHLVVELVENQYQPQMAHHVVHLVGHQMVLDIASIVLDRPMVVASMDTIDLDRKYRAVANSNLAMVACPSPTTDENNKYYPDFIQMQFPHKQQT